MSVKKIFIALAFIVSLFAFTNYTYSQSCCDKKCEIKSNCDKNCTCQKDSKNCSSDRGKTGTSQGVLDSGKVCPVAGEKIDGQGVKLSYLGKEYTFCCEGCAEKFKKEPLDYIKGEILCPVMGETASKENFTEYNGTKYYFCCAPCIKKFNKDPEKYKDGFKENR